MLRRADAAIAGNHEAMEVLKAKGWQREIDVLPQFGVDEDEFRPMVAGTGASPAPTIGYVGRLVPEKGVDLLLDALAGLPDQVRLVIVGAGSMRDELQRMAARLGIAARVEFRPAVPSVHMPSVYAGLDILVLPSRSRPNWKEQFGRVLIEAMACQVPVVGSTCGEIPNVIGDAGLVFQEGDARALQEQLQALLAKPEWRADLAQRGRARVLARYTMRRIADATADIYRRLHRGTERV